MFHNHYGKRNFMLINFLPSVDNQFWHSHGRMAGRPVPSASKESKALIFAQSWRQALIH
jgi:hypothetical protein